MELPQDLFLTCVIRLIILRKYAWEGSWHPLDRRWHDDASETFEFIGWMKELNTKQCRMFSSDVSSLFINLSITETIGYLFDYIKNSEVVSHLLKEYLERLFFFCKHEVQYKFTNQIYCQKSMHKRGPLRPILTDILLAKFE